MRVSPREAIEMGIAENRKRSVMRDLEKLQPADETIGDDVGQGIRVLIVDDERDTVMTLGILLRSSGFDVHLVQAAAEVSMTVGQLRPHAVLLDIGMPERNGYEVAKELRSIYGARCPVLLAVTARAGASDRRLAESSGFSHYFAKPCDPAELIRVLSSLQTASA